ncbi:hypothetical protein C8J56DRAFT_1022530 [Mycena floridula]|nr:hypothetical protein C8J56DRAFT_1022530 [Mycena floridula]
MMRDTVTVTPTPEATLRLEALLVTTDHLYPFHPPSLFPHSLTPTGSVTSAPIGPSIKSTTARSISIPRRTRHPRRHALLTQPTVRPPPPFPPLRWWREERWIDGRFGWYANDDKSRQYGVGKAGGEAGRQGGDDASSTRISRTRQAMDFGLGSLRPEDSRQADGRQQQQKEIWKSKEEDPSQLSLRSWVSLQWVFAALILDGFS